MHTGGESDLLWRLWLRRRSRKRHKLNSTRSCRYLDVIRAELQCQFRRCPTGQVSARRNGAWNVKRSIAALAFVVLTSLVMLAAVPAEPAAAWTAAQTFGYGPNGLQTVTVYSPTTPNSESVVLVHGGGFSSSADDAAKLAENARSLTADGDTVFVVNYRDDTPPDGVDIAGQVADIVDGTLWVIDNAANFGSNGDDLTLIGGSSGGLLVGDAAEELNNASPDTVTTVITISATEDFAGALAYWGAYGGPLGALHLNNLTTVLSCPVTQSDHSTQYNCSPSLEILYSPDQQVTSGNCPNQWLIFNGDNEEQPSSQAAGMDDALIAAGCPQTLDIFPDTAHAFDYWRDVLGQIQGAIAAT